jgi:transaldolase
MPADGGDCEVVLAEFSRQGVDIESLAAELQRDGTAAFAKSWNSLMDRIIEKSTKLTRNTG